MLHGVTQRVQCRAVAHYFLFQTSELRAILETATFLLSSEGSGAYFSQVSKALLILPKMTAIHYKPLSASTL